MNRENEARVRVLMPVFDDWDAALVVLGAIDAMASKLVSGGGPRVSVLLVDDGSTHAPPAAAAFAGLGALGGVDILRLRRNLGHQRAIAVGLAYVEAHLPCDAVVVMDSDGEDDAGDVPRLLDALGAAAARPIVFARRARRSEGASFAFFYAVYRALYAVFVGRALRSGNFSVIPREQLGRVVVLSEIWNHYASGLQKARLPLHEVPTSRGKRVAGQSKMGFPALVMHGLSAIAVHSDVVSARAIVGSLLVTVLAVCASVTVLVMKFAFHRATPGWATEVISSATVIALQTTMFATLFAFLTLGLRSAMGFIPSQHYESFVLRIERVVGDPPAA